MWWEFRKKELWKKGFRNKHFRKKTVCLRDGWTMLKLSEEKGVLDAGEK